MADKSLTPIDLPELSSAPASPDSGFHRFYAKTDGKAYSKSSAGTEYDLTTGVSLTTTGTSGAATLVGTTLNIPVYQSALTNPVTGTGANTRLTYWSGTNTVTSTANMTWDAGTSRMVVSGAIRSTPLSTDTFAEAFVINLSSGATPGGTYYIKNNANSLYLAGFGMATNDVRFANYVSNGKVFFYTNNAGTGGDRMQLWQNGNLLIQSGGTFTDNGQRLQVYGSTLLRGAGTTSATTALLVQNSTPTANFTIRDDGGFAFRGGTVGVAQTGYTTFANLSTDRTCDANATTIDELADILGTLIEDLKTKGIISA